MIVDEADTDIAMAEDPFLEAGINIPEELPYQPTPQVTRRPRRPSIQSLTSISKTLNSFKNKTSTAADDSSKTNSSTNHLASFRKKFVSSGESFNITQSSSPVKDMCSTAPEISNSPDDKKFVFPTSTMHSKKNTHRSSPNMKRTNSHIPFGTQISVISSSIKEEDESDLEQGYKY